MTFLLLLVGVTSSNSLQEVLRIAGGLSSPYLQLRGQLITPSVLGKTGAFSDVGFSRRRCNDLALGSYRSTDGFTAFSCRTYLVEKVFQILIVHLKHLGEKPAF